ncbi:hypothetical protein ACH4S8_41440 [Streptomyces sp. NPDC021080]|uniref:hypothetical protein n=1 Tax=Streptomyces sp. NPDC021080 TaxID=3365110 RepID=UPI0037A0DF0B
MSSTSKPLNSTSGLEMSSWFMFRTPTPTRRFSLSHRSHRYRGFTGGTHVHDLYRTCPDRLRPMPTRQPSAFHAPTDRVEHRAAPTASGTAPRPASKDLVNSGELP